MENSDLQEPLEKRANSVSRGYPAIQEDKALRDPSAFQECRVCQERRGRGDLQVHQAQQVKGVQMGHAEAEGHEELQEHREPRARLATTAHQVPRETRVLKDHRDRTGFQDPRDQMALQERTGCQVIQAKGGSRDSKGKQDYQDLSEWSDHRAKLERLDQLGTEVTLGHRDLQENKVCLDRQAKKVPRVIRDPWGFRERVALLGDVGLEAVEACQAPRVLLV